MCQVQPNHYSFNSYVPKKRFCSYWHQLNEVIQLNPESILGIGIGDGLVFDHLKREGFKIVTMDIDSRLKPNYIGSVLSMPFPNQHFEVIACFQVLEHLPYHDFCKALYEIYRVSSKYAIISLPDESKTYPFYIKIPKIKEIRILIPVPRFRIRKYKFDGQHYWGIGKRGYPLDRIIGDIKRSGFELVKSYQVFEMPLHRFFVLKR